MVRTTDAHSAYHRRGVFADDDEGQERSVAAQNRGRCGKGGGMRCWVVGVGGRDKGDGERGGEAKKQGRRGKERRGTDRGDTKQKWGGDSIC